MLFNLIYLSSGINVSVQPLLISDRVPPFVAAIKTIHNWMIFFPQDVIVKKRILESISGDDGLLGLNQSK